MDKKIKNPFAGVRKIVAHGIICMLLFAIVSCESSKVPYALDEKNEECVCECDFDDDDFLSELNEENCISRWAVELRVRHGIRSIEVPEIKALVARHDVTLSPSFYNTTNPVLMRYYTLKGEDCSNLCCVRAIIRAFLATDLFEHYVRVFGPSVPNMDL